MNVLLIKFKFYKIKKNNNKLMINTADTADS